MKPGNGDHHQISNANVRVIDADSRKLNGISTLTSTEHLTQLCQGWQKGRNILKTPRTEQTNEDTNTFMRLKICIKITSSINKYWEATVTIL